jgi:hypothetical protein
MKSPQNINMGKVCILVVSHNNKDLTDSLCHGIVERTSKVDYDLHVIETGSKLDNVSMYMTLWVHDGCRMTRGFNLLKQYADFTAAMKGYQYDAYQLFVNDAKFIDNQDMVSILYEQMMANEEIGQIHPYIQNMSHVHQRQCNQNSGGARKESFVEIICPMLRAEAWNRLPDLLDNRFYYGWGLDYDIPHQLHQNGYRTYVSDSVGIFHQPFTSYRDKHITQETMSQGEFIPTARTNMEAGMVAKYGDKWKRVLYDGVPGDVNNESLYMWLNSNDGFNL